MQEYSPEFSKALQFVLRFEGGYSNHPNDRGGPTNQGITQLTYDAYRKLNGQKLNDVRYLANDERDAIYYYNYWRPLCADEMSWPENLILFDFAVNSGLSRAKRYQNICKNESANVVDCLVRRREDFYRKIAVGSQRVFLNGWMNRLKALKREAGLEE